MTTPTHIRFVFRGEFQNTPEEWSFSCHFRRDVAALPDVEVDDISETAVTEALLTFFSSSRFQTGVHALDWRAYVIGTDGRLEGDKMIRVDVSTSGIGGTGNTKHPPQVALVATTVGASRGLAQRGRMYLPGPATPLSTDYRISQAEADAYAEDVSTFLKDVSGAIDIPNSVINAPAVNISSVGAGRQQEIDHIEVGRVYDTMRSRRRALVEDRQSTGHIDW